MSRGKRCLSELRTCERCGAAFEVRLAREKRTQRFCSVACSARWLGDAYGRTAPRYTRNVSETERLCRTCERVLPFSEFYSANHTDRESRPSKRYYASDCKVCTSELRRMDRYGTTLAAMIERQGSDICPLCETRKADSLDHDHATGEPRGALCRKCNLIMHYMDDAGWRARAEAYIACQI